MSSTTRSTSSPAPEDSKISQPMSTSSRRLRDWREYARVFPPVVIISRRRMLRPPEDMNMSAKEGSLIEDCSLKTAILRMASSSLERRERRAGMSAWSIVPFVRGERRQLVGVSLIRKVIWKRM